jgi:hypothetical protein
MTSQRKSDFLDGEGAARPPRSSAPRPPGHRREHRALVLVRGAKMESSFRKRESLPPTLVFTRAPGSRQARQLGVSSQQ